MKIKFALLLCALALPTLACGVIDSVLGNVTGGTEKRVSQLWSDVPRMDGLNQADFDPPLATKVMLQGALKAISEGAGSIDFVAFATSKTPADFQNFYTKQRMTAAGWNNKDATGCATSAGAGADVGIFCLFGKKEGNKETFLAIIGGQDDKTKQFQVFFARMEITGTPTPSK
jgi:hypothetical protein